MQKSSDTLQNYFAIREERSKVKCRATGARDNNVLVLGSSLEHFVKHAKAVFTSSYVFFFKFFINPFITSGRQLIKS